MKMGCCGQKYWDFTPSKILEHFGLQSTRETAANFEVLDRGRSILKLLMVNFLFHCADGTWLIECAQADTTGVQK
jgi:hypothetical protein